MEPCITDRRIVRRIKMVKDFGTLIVVVMIRARKLEEEKIVPKYVLLRLNMLISLH